MKLIILSLSLAGFGSALFANEAGSSANDFFIKLFPSLANAPEFSVGGMFLQADNVVKTVMILLVLASILTWGIWVSKLVTVYLQKRKLRSAYQDLANTRVLPERTDRVGRNPADLILAAAQDEVRLSKGEPSSEEVYRTGLKERVDAHIARAEAGVLRRLGSGTGVLASISSTAPFIGLFGTVWGIMNSFIGISESQSTNLAVVAPGIAEALLATALGLVAAIPATMFYNHLVRTIGGYKLILQDYSTLVQSMLSRDLDYNRIQTTIESEEQ